MGILLEMNKNEKALQMRLLTFWGERKVKANTTISYFLNLLVKWNFRSNLVVSSKFRVICLKEDIESYYIRSHLSRCSIVSYDKLGYKLFSLWTVMYAYIHVHQTWISHSTITLVAFCLNQLDYLNK